MLWVREKEGSIEERCSLSLSLSLSLSPSPTLSLSLSVSLLSNQTSIWDSMAPVLESPVVLE